MLFMCRKEYVVLCRKESVVYVQKGICCLCAKRICCLGGEKNMFLFIVIYLSYFHSFFVVYLLFLLCC